MRGILRWLWRHRWRIGAGLIVLLVIDAVQMVLPWLVGRAIDDFARGHQDQAGRFAALILVTGLVMASLRFFWRYLLIGAARRIRRDLRSHIYAHLLRLEPAFYDAKPTGELMALATNDIDAVTQACGFGMLALFDALFLVAFTIVAMSLIAPELLFQALAPLPVLAAFVVIAGRRIHGRFEVVQERFAGLTERVREAIAGVRVVKGFAREREFAADFAVGSKDYLRANFSLIRLSASFDPVIAALSGVATVIVLWSGGRLAIDGTITIGGFVAFTTYLGMLTWPMMAIGWVINLLQRGSASMKRIEQVLDRAPGIVDAPDAVSFPREAGIACTALTFRYPQRRDVTGVHSSDEGRPALAGCAFDLNPGATLGIIGLTGSGKTTLAHLLLRLVDPPPGTLSIGGVDVRRIRLDELRRHAALVPQDPFLFALSIRDNIRFARPEATQDEVERAARLACIHDEIVGFPQGYDAMLGERGVTLSGGQRQRVAIARAVIGDPRLLVLDDCLSAVDAATEAAVIANLHGFLHERTAVVISHRIAAVQASDLILVFSHGTMVEQGVHVGLLASGGLYARLADLQRAEEAIGS
ncbi:MAG: ABC transporter ATP-binding protein [Planctomycetes bacterium]|nr:ABC transporter ATP-binding protein [Planctomycetota bacterium]